MHDNTKLIELMHLVKLATHCIYAIRNNIIIRNYGLAVGHLAWKARDAGSSPAQRYTFCLCEKFTPEKIIYLNN